MKTARIPIRSAATYGAFLGLLIALMGNYPFDHTFGSEFEFAAFEIVFAAATLAGFAAIFNWLDRKSGP